MRLWTIQKFSTYERFKETGRLMADENFIYDDMIFHYRWMVDQMKKRIGPPPLTDIEYLIWECYQWDGINKKNPDLRFSGHLPKDARGVCIEFEANPKDVLLSDFNDFYIVFKLWITID